MAALYLVRNPVAGLEGGKSSEEVGEGESRSRKWVFLFAHYPLTSNMVFSPCTLSHPKGRLVSGQFEGLKLSHPLL